MSCFTMTDPTLATLLVPCLLLALAGVRPLLRRLLPRPA